MIAAPAPHAPGAMPGAASVPAPPSNSSSCTTAPANPEPARTPRNGQYLQASAGGMRVFRYKAQPLQV